MLGTLSVAVSTLALDKDIVVRALSFIGGESKARRVVSLKVKGVGLIGLNEQSERYTGPILKNFVDFDSKLDFIGSKISGEYKYRGAQLERWTPLKVSVDFASKSPIRAAGFQSAIDFRDQLRLSPSRLLLNALHSKLLRLPDVREGTERYQRLQFLTGKDTITLWFRNTPGNLDRVEHVGPRDQFWAAWKTVNSTTKFSNWQQVAGSVVHPFHVEETRNGQRFAEWTYTGIEAEDGNPISDADLEREQKTLDIEPLEFPVATPKIKKLAEGIWQFPGMFPCEVLEGSSELLIVDAPYGAAYCAEVLKQITASFPGKKIVGVVLSDPYWPHQAGFPAFDKLNVPVYVEWRNMPLFKDLSRNRSVKVRFKSVSKPLQLGETWKLIPMNGISSERFLSVWIPGQKTLFCSDSLSWQSKTKLYNPAAALDIKRMVDTEDLKVESVFATHSILVPWKQVLSALEVGR